MSFCCTSEGSKSCGYYTPPAKEAEGLAVETFLVSTQSWQAFIIGWCVFPVSLLVLLFVVKSHDIGSVIGASVVLLFILVNGLSEMGKTYLILDKGNDKVSKVRTGFFGLISSEKVLGSLSELIEFEYVVGPCFCAQCCVLETKVMAVFTDNITQKITSGDKKIMEKMFDPIRHSVFPQVMITL
eukprot:71441_1